MPTDRTAIKYKEELPEQCPPGDAFEPSENLVYRLVESNPPTQQDFFSHRKLWPQKEYHTDECRARSISVFFDIVECDLLRALPAHKTKKIAKVKVDESAGKMLSTGRDPSHHSWWIYSGFEAHNNCEIVS